MESLKVVSFLASGLAGYLVPTFLFYNKNMAKTTIIESGLEFTEVGIKDIIIKTNNSNTNNYVLRRDTIKVYDTNKKSIVEEKYRTPKTFSEINTNNVSLNVQPLKLMNNVDIVGFYDVNSLIDEKNKKRVVCHIEALRLKDRYLIAVDNKTNKVICIGEGDQIARFHWILRKRSGYIRELWLLEGLLLSYALYLYIRK